MKHLKYLFLFIGLALFASCSESDVEGGVIAGKNQAQFSGVVKELQTRVTGTSWDENDEIGIHALIGEQEVVYDNMSNVQYKTTSGDGVFAPVSSAIRFPDDGSNLDFVAYYPYNSNLTDLEYTLERGTDLLYSNNAKGHNNGTPDVSLEFKHAMSKLVLNVGLGDNLTSLEGLTVTINNVSTTGKVNLANGDVTVDAAETIIPTVVFAEGNSAATITELVMPTQDLQNVEVMFTLGDNTYKWSPSVETVLASNMQYGYKLNLNVEAGELVAVEIGTATIGEWEKGHEDDDFTNLDPVVDEEGEKITIADLRTDFVKGKTYAENHFIEGEVILNPSLENVTAFIAYIADETAGLTIAFTDAENVLTKMPLGAKVKINVQNSVWDEYNGLTQLKLSTDNVEIIEETSSTPLEPRVVTIQDIIDKKYQSELVQINDVQFKEVPATYNGNNALVNESNEEVNVYTRSQATFAEDNVPEGNGPFIGVVSFHYSPQLLIRSLDDLTGMTGERVGDEGVTDPQPGEGDGSKENPYTVAQAIAKQDGSEAWVRGYIVGYKKGSGYNVEFSVDGALGSNIAIADSKDETDGTKVLGVQLTNKKPARTDLNLQGNPEMFHAEVLLFGNLEPYFTPDEGLKNVEEYVLIEDGDIPVIIDFSVDKSAVVLNAETELTSTVKLTTDANQAWTVASDAAWLTVAPASGSGNADIVLAAEEYTEETSRTATVTISPTDNTDLTAIVVTVTQNGKLASGGDFATDLFFSGYVEGSSSNKYLEIYNGTGATVDLYDYKIVLYSNGATKPGNTLDLEGTLDHGAVIVIANPSAVLYDGDVINSNVTFFNGDDAVALEKISTETHVDIIGRIGEQVKWDAGGDLKTEDRTLVRKPSVKGGVTVNPTEGFPTLATEWIGYPVDTADYLGSHTTDY